MSRVPMPSVFISHSSLDNDFVRKLGRGLEDRGIQVWLDVVNLEHGKDIEATVRAAIEKYDFLLVVLSKHSVASAWAHFEVGLATSRKLSGGQPRVLPVVVDDCKLPVYVEDKRYVDFRTADLFDATLSDLVSSIVSAHKALVRARFLRALLWAGALSLFIGLSSWVGYREWQASIDQAQMLPQLAQRAYDQIISHPDISRKLTEELNERFPDHPEALRIKGWSYWYDHKAALALQAFTRGWERSPDKSSATARGLRVGMANSLADLGGKENLAKAREYYNELIAQYGHTNAYVNLARLSLIERDYTAAAEAFKVAHDRLAPEYRAPEQNRPLAYATTGWALVPLLVDPNADPGKPLALLAEAICYDREVLLFLLVGQETLGHYGYARFTAPWNALAKRPETQKWLSDLNLLQPGQPALTCPR